MSNIYQNSNNDESLYNQALETKPKHPECHFEQQSTNIDIPSSSNSKDLFYSQMSPQYQEFYNDILSFTSDSSLLDAYPIAHSSIHNNASSSRDNVDPMNDPQFMEFLSSLSTSEPTPSSRPSSEPSMLMFPNLDIRKEENELNQDVKKKKANNNYSNKRIIKTIKKRTSATNTRLGQCEHPKHSLYRQEKYILSAHSGLSTDEIFTATSIQSIPRRGRPPKGSKSTEFVYSTSLVTTPMAEENIEPPTSNVITPTPFYPMVELTVRPLPKRLEAVVGKTNIKVCLTCLKRSDMDPVYLKDAAYVGPQTLLKRKK